MQFFFLLPRNLLLAYQSFGVVYGDLSTSPLYVFRSVFAASLQNHQNPEVIFGAFSLIFWALTLIPLLKYTCIVLSADDCGEGGTFALYSLLCRHAKFSLLPNQQAADEELSSYKYGSSGGHPPPSSSSLTRYLERHKKSRTILLVVVLLGASMVIGDGVITPAISVLSAVSAFQVKGVGVALTHGELVLLACAVLVGLFALQHYGTHRVAIVFAPVIIMWLLSIFSIGLYNIIRWNPKIIRAFSPHYIIKYFSETRKEGWISLGGVLLSITGTEAMFADLGHFTASSIRLAFGFFVYPCLVIQYMGQAAYLSKNVTSIHDSFYKSIPEPIFWPVFALANLAAVVGSQAIITATFSIVKQCHALGHNSSWKCLWACLHDGYVHHNFSHGTRYNLCVAEKAYIWHIVSCLFWVDRGCVPIGCNHESSSRRLGVSFACLCVMFVMFVWHYGTRRKYKHDMHNKVQLKWLLNLGPTLGIVRVPGIGLIYSELATGIPSIFSHFVMNLPAFHNVLVFICVKYVPVPFVSPDERCIMRYGYKDIPKDDKNFENQLTQSIAEFIQMEAVGPQSPNSEGSSFDGRMAVISTRSMESRPALIISDQANPTQTMRSSRLKVLRCSYDEERPAEPRRRVRFELAPSNNVNAMDGGVRDELLALVEAKEAGVAYIMGFFLHKGEKGFFVVKEVYDRCRVFLLT
ncbi:hypothetical protein OSB04_013969 [Centaurea solstitialis]|uniref:Potassium transporter n=1 Tax=Centaurea solstitialis TaxID=347529 RepID=A0AA38WNV7_9ASTR|nr:hypothetical protein OSB04_013969 [Centaurea solstitialis]